MRRSPALAACTSTAVVEGPVRLGQTAYVSGPKVRPDRVIEDSRCPINARCVWAGRVVLRATVSGGGWSKQLDLNLGEPVVVADGKITLVAVTPERMAGTAVGKPPRYRFTFDFQGGL